MPKGDFWDKIKTRLIEVSNAAADFTEEQAVVGKLKFDILNLNRRIDRNKNEIGDIVLQISRSSDPYNPLEDGEVVKRLASIGDLESQIAFKRSEITRAVDEIRSRRKATEPVAPAKKTVAPSGPTSAKKPAPVAKKPVAPVTKKPVVKKPSSKPEPKSEKA